MDYTMSKEFSKGRTKISHAPGTSTFSDSVLNDESGRMSESNHSSTSSRRNPSHQLAPTVGPPSLGSPIYTHTTGSNEVFNEPDQRAIESWKHTTRTSHACPYARGAPAGHAPTTTTETQIYPIRPAIQNSGSRRARMILDAIEERRRTRQKGYMPTGETPPRIYPGLIATVEPQAGTSRKEVPQGDVMPPDNLLLSFDDRDLEGIITPHNDPVVISIEINRVKIHRMLVDTGSPVDILYARTFDGLGMSREDLRPLKTPWWDSRVTEYTPWGLLKLI